MINLTTAKALRLTIPPATLGPGERTPQCAMVFSGKADCTRCHVPPLFTEPGWNMHTPEEIRIDGFQASRAPDGRYRTSPLRGLWTHLKGGFYHDGRFKTLADVVEHYNSFFGLALTVKEKQDLIEYLKSL